MLPTTPLTRRPVKRRTGIPASTRSCSIVRGEIAVSAVSSPLSTIVRSSS